MSWPIVVPNAVSMMNGFTIVQVSSEQALRYENCSKTYGPLVARG